MKRNKARSIFVLILVMASMLLTPMMGFASSVTHPGIADETSERSLTIWKYELDSMSQAGPRGDGTHDPDPNRTPLPGVDFRITRVTPATGVSLICPLAQTEASGAFTRDASSVIVTTDNTGMAHHVFGVGTSVDGIYLVEEITPVPNDLGITRPVDPFFVHVPMTRRVGTGAQTELIYAIHVHPKNVTMDCLDPRKTIGDGVEMGDNHSVIAGADFYWHLRLNLPSDFVRVITEPGEFTRNTMNATFTAVQTETYTVTQAMIDAGIAAGFAGHPVTAVLFEIRDVLHPEVILNSYVVEVYTPGAGAAAGTWTALSSAQYTLTRADANGGTQNDLTFRLTEAAKRHLYQGDYTEIRIRLDARVPVGFNGYIVNTFTYRYLGPDWEIEPGEGESPETVYFTGGYNLFKRSNTTGNALAGATFHIATSLTNAQQGIFLASNGESFPHTATLPTGVTFLTTTSGADGIASFNGLPLHAGAGFTVPVDPTMIALLTRDFWVVETEAPTGYELLAAPVQITVTTSTHTLTGAEIRVIDNHRNTLLPFTGGIGTAMFVIGSMLIAALGAGAFAWDKKRRRED